MCMESLWFLSQIPSFCTKNQGFSLVWLSFYRNVGFDVAIREVSFFGSNRTFLSLPIGWRKSLVFRLHLRLSGLSEKTAEDTKRVF